MTNFQTNFKSYLKQITNDEDITNLNCDYLSTDEFNSKYSNLNHRNIMISVIHANIRSLNANQSKLKQLLLELKVKFSVIVLSEIWGTNATFLKNILDGYNFFYELPLCGTVGGVGMFINKDLNTNIRDDLKIVSTNYKIETLFVEIKVEKMKYIVGGIYRHPGTNIKLFTADVDKNFSKNQFN